MQILSRASRFHSMIKEQVERNHRKNRFMQLFLISENALFDTLLVTFGVETLREMNQLVEHFLVPGTF